MNDSQTEKCRHLVHRLNCKLCAFTKTKGNLAFSYLAYV